MYDNKNSLGTRLAEERKRLGLSQQELAEACDSTRESIGKYERDVNVPGGEILMSLARLGMDTQYVLTGVHSMNLYQVAEEAPKYRPEPTKKQVDQEVLLGVLMGVKEYLNETGRELSPAKETELVMLLLDLMSPESVHDKSAVREAVEKVILFKYKRR
ncbi:MAG: helix-turn-helix transcriptional regulator [Pseudomonadota bacterium]